MPRVEQFAIGIAVISAALAVLLKIEFYAYLALAVGLILIIQPYVQDIRWGADRPSLYEIQTMSADEYKARVLGNPKLEHWVNHVKGHRSRPTWKVFIPLTILLALGATLAWQMRKATHRGTRGQWTPVSYDAQKGYTFYKDDVEYSAHCRAIQLTNNSRAIEVEIESKCSDILPFIGKPVLVTHEILGVGGDVPAALTIHLPDGTKYEFEITGAKAK